MLKHAMTLAVAGALAATGSAQAQESYSGAGFGPTVGDWELILGAGGSNDNDFEAGGFNLNAEVGYYFTEQLSVGGRQGISFADSDAGSSSTLQTSIFVDYHFDMGAFRPFVGGSVGYIYGNQPENSFTAGPEAGVKWYVKDQTFVYGRVSYDFIFEDADQADDAIDDGVFNYAVGIGFNF